MELTDSYKPDTPEKIAYQADIYTNRLIKRSKHLRKWARRSNVFCYRIYDKDIPEIPLAVDYYQDIEDNEYLVIALYERPYDKPEAEEEVWMNAIKHASSFALSIPESNIFTKIRRRQKGDSQYEKIAEGEKSIIIKEQGQLFQINLSDYLDTGLFFDHRPLRLAIRSQAANKTVLNLFCYTGSFSVYAAQGKASAVDSVDLSKKYLSLAKNNFSLNKLVNDAYTFIESDSLTFLESTKKNWDIIILDPPTFSNSKKTETTLDINKDWPTFVNLCIEHLNPKGILYFSTNSLRLKFEEELVAPDCLDILISDISEETIPEDYRNTKIHRCWKIQKT